MSDISEGETRPYPKPKVRRINVDMAEQLKIVAQFEREHPGFNADNWRRVFDNEDEWSDEFRRINRAYVFKALSEVLKERDAQK